MSQIEKYSVHDVEVICQYRSQIEEYRVSML